MVNLLGTEIHNVSLQESIDIICSFVESGEFGHYVVTPNVDHLVKLQSDDVFRRIYQDASLVVADGVPLIWASRYLGTPLKEKVSGSDLFPELCAQIATKGYKVFFLGGRDGAALKAKEVLTTKHPELNVVGTYCPPFGFENDAIENQKIIELLKKAKPDILFVGLGAPKQEKWVAKYRKEYHIPVSIGIGVSFEFVANMVKRAPKFMQKIGLEWFWRLISEPKRLWKRYLLDDRKFFKLVYQQKQNQKFD